jgi:hypothetical protein
MVVNRMVDVIDRQEFIHNRWKYKAGEHVTFIGKTQSGKTTLALELLDVTITPKLQTIILVMKPRDKVPAEGMKALGLKRVRTWPPPNASKWYPKPPRGWVLWPKLGNIKRDNVVLRQQFDRALTESYAAGARRNGSNRIIFADEVTGLSKELSLEPELNAIWMRGSAMGLGLWAATQRPFYAPMYAYGAAVHLFLHRDTDKRNTDRYREIGGVDPDLVRQVTNSMDEHQFLYIRRTDNRMCIVDA